jgi:predicted DNA-binding protein
MAETKGFQVKLSGETHERLTAAADRHGVSMQVYAQQAIDSTLLMDEALILAAECLETYGEAFGLDPEGNAAKVAELRAGATGNRLAA